MVEQGSRILAKGCGRPCQIEKNIQEPILNKGKKAS